LPQSQALNTTYLFARMNINSYVHTLE